MTKKELRQIRIEVGFSMQDMSDYFKISKSTYARYEDGTAAVPEEIDNGSKALRKSNKLFFANMDTRIAADLPGGICPNELRY